MAITDFAVPPRPQPGFYRNGLFEAFALKRTEWKWKPPLGKWRGGNAGMDGGLPVVAASSDCGEAICTNFPCMSQGEAACH